MHHGPAGAKKVSHFGNKYGFDEMLGSISVHNLK